MTEQPEHTPARGPVPAPDSPTLAAIALDAATGTSRVVYLFEPRVAIPNWPNGWWIAGIDLASDTRVLLDTGGCFTAWCPLKNLEAIRPIDPEFKNALLKGARPTERVMEVPPVELEPMLEHIRSLSKEGAAANLRRQLDWLGIRDGEVFALQTVGPRRGDPNYLALCRSVGEAIELAKPASLVASNRWGKVEPIPYQGIYIIGNLLVGRVDEVFAPGRWAIMPEGVITDARIIKRREMYFDLDTQRRDEQGKPVDLPISATRAELHLTIARALVILHEIIGALNVAGIDRPADVIAFMMSGNGVQIWFALDNVPESPELHAIVRELLAIWAGMYDSDVSHVDTGVHDAKRIGPLAGTPKRKGIRTELHRLVTFEGSKSPRRLTLAELQALARYYRSRLTSQQRQAVAKNLGVRPASPKPPPAGRRDGLSACNQISIRDVAAKLGIDSEKPICPSCGSGGGSDVAFLAEENLLNCKHARCSSRPNRTPVDLVAKVAFNCDNIAGTKGIASRVLGWFTSNFGVGGRS